MKEVLKVEFTQSKIQPNKYYFDIICDDINIIVENKHILDINYIEPKNSNHFPYFILSSNTSIIMPCSTINLIDKEDIKPIQEFIDSRNKLINSIMKNTEVYYYLDDELNILSDTNQDLDIDRNRYEIGNYFITKEKAEEYRDKIRLLLSNKK